MTASGMAKHTKKCTFPVINKKTNTYEKTD